MGSFLMSCAVTGATITEGADVVAFKMKQEKVPGRGSPDLFNTAWFICDFPCFGTYNDYGNVLLEDGTEINSPDEDYMLMYKWAWETLVDIVKKDEKEEDERYEEYNRQGLGYVNYRLKRIQDAKNAIDSHLDNKTNSIEDLDEIIASLTPEEISQKVKALLSQSRVNDALRWGGEGCHTSDSFWQNRILSDDNPHEIHDRFLNEVLIIMKSKHYIYFRMMPSMYGSQESNAEQMIQLFERGIQYFKKEIEANYES